MAWLGGVDSQLLHIQHRPRRRSTAHHSLIYDVLDPSIVAMLGWSLERLLLSACIHTPITAFLCAFSLPKISSDRRKRVRFMPRCACLATDKMTAAKSRVISGADRRQVTRALHWAMSAFAASYANEYTLHFFCSLCPSNVND